MRSIVRIEARSSRCDRNMQGTGFVVARERVMTAAHVVAGSDGRTEVMTEGGQGHPATVVLYDPRRDLAVLRVPGIAALALPMNRGAGRGDRAVMAGFRAEGRSLFVRQAGIRTEDRAAGPDIYQNGFVVRRIFAISASVDPGLSGSPLLAPNGAVDGMVFAADLGEKNAGFALTAKEIASSVRMGATRTRPVTTRGCAK
jgi:S1-C subfamily serine protease